MARLTALERDLLAWTKTKLRYAESALAEKPLPDHHQRLLAANAATAVLLRRGNRLLLAYGKRGAR